MSTRRELFDCRGKLVSLGGKLGGGGEGDVYEVKGRTDVVAKLYHKKVSTEKSAKIATMLNLRTERLSKLSAWPVDTLHSRPNGELVGFLMSKVKDHNEIHFLYGPKTRMTNFPSARWPFLIRTSANIARAFQIVHEHGQVIGDVNHGSVLVSLQATVTLVDCDSFQITAQGRHFLCEVGMGTHTPPELQGKKLNGVIRTKEHDSFGLSVLIFQLLFLGRHPFSGRPLDTDQMAIEKAIHEYRFAYGRDARSRNMLPPPATLSLEALPLSLVNLFERAFLRGKQRPLAQEWVVELESLEKSLTTCRINDGHHYWKSLTACPWCEIRKQTVYDPLPPIKISSSAFNLTDLWNQVNKLSPPSYPSWKNCVITLLSKPPQNSTLNPGSSTPFISQAHVPGIYLILIAICLILSLSNMPTIWTAIALTLICAVSIPILCKIAIGFRARSLFKWKHSVLEGQKTKYEGLNQLRTKKLNELSQHARERQLSQHLDKHRIQNASILKIGPGRKLTLQSYGIETADDVTWSNIRYVPGFGPALTSELMAWRQRCESSFVFNPAISVNQSDRDQIDRDIASQRQSLEVDLRNGLQELERLSKSNLHYLPKSIFVPALLIYLVSVTTFIPLRSEFDKWKKQPETSRVSPSPTTTFSPTLTTYQKSLDELRVEARSYYEQGVELTKSGKYGEAVSNYQQAIQINHDFAEAHHELGYAYFKLKKYDDAVTALQKAIKLNPEWIETTRVLGMVYMAKQNWQSAIEAFETAIRFESKNPQLFYQLGLAYKCKGNLSAAVKKLQQAIELKSDYAVAYFELGNIYIDLKEEEQAWQQYQTLQTLDEKLANKLYVRLSLEGI